jgi:outer membrane protein assembly factor BamB
MSEERTYLERTTEAGGQRFYEIVVKGKKLTIHFGLTGHPGQTLTRALATPTEAKAQAQQKIARKTRKGYAPPGKKKKQPAPHHSESTPSTARQAPVLWKFATKGFAFGIFIVDNRCWMGNENGEVFALDHEGEVQRKFKLPDGVKCLVGDHDWLYAGCDDGNVYDLTGRVPRLAYTIADHVDLLWLDICGGVLAVSDRNGGVTVIDAEEEQLWAKKSQGSSGWMVRCTRDAVFHGHDSGVTAFALSNGKQLWHHKLADNVLFGWQTATAVHAGCRSGNIYRLSKKTGKVELTCKADGIVLSNATSMDERYIFAGDNSSTVYCFDDKGNRLWALGTGCGQALSMQYHDEKLYIVTTDGTLACLDASEAAIEAAHAGTLPKTRELKAPKKGVAQADTTELETTSDASSGVVVQCVEEGSRIRVRVVTKGYHKDWNVQFPRNLRAVGERFVVDEVREASQGGFYRARGDIRRLTT